MRRITASVLDMRETDVDLAEAPLNLATMFEAVADVLPDRVILSHAGADHTYRDLEARANRLAHALQQRGVGAGDHVAVHLRNRIEYVETVLACLKLRAVPINVNYRFTPAELQYLYADSESVALVIGEGDLAPALEAAADCLRLRDVLVLGPVGGEAGPRGAPDLSAHTAAAETAGVRLHDYAATSAAEPEERLEIARSADDQLIIYTGGTTGYPKGVQWRHEDLYFAALSGGNLRGEPRRTVAELVAAAEASAEVRPLIVIPPLMHGNAIFSVLIALLAGTHRVIVDKFDPAAILDLVARYDAMGMTVVGDGMARPLLDQMRIPGAPDVSRIEVIGSGGALLSDEVKAGIRRFAPEVRFIDSFGSTETGQDGVLESGPGGIKYAVAKHPDLRLVGDDLEQVAVGEEGNFARLGHVPLGYYNDPVKTAETFRTIEGRRAAVLGDRGLLTEDGRIVFLGRGSTCINTGGEKVFPEEVEQALKAHPRVADAIVVGVPDERMGSAVAAVIAPTGQPDGQAAAEEAELTTSITAHCREVLAGYKVPRHYRYVTAAARTASGKADYHWAAEQFTGSET